MEMTLLKDSYVPPEVDVLRVQVELGFYGTGGGGYYPPPSGGGGGTSSDFGGGASADPWDAVGGVWE